MNQKNAVERNANIVGPHPQPFSRMEKGAIPLSLRERVGVRAKPLPLVVAAVVLNCGFQDE
jgi:hypothetical protein